MAADPKEILILQGFAQTGGIVAADQLPVTQGYGPTGAAPPAPADAPATCRTALGVGPSRTSLTVKC